MHLHKIIIMKKIMALIIFSSGATTLLAQNVGIGSNTPQGKLHIRGSENVSQLIIDANSSQTNTSPLIKLRSNAGNDIMWIHADTLALRLE